MTDEAADASPLSERNYHAVRLFAEQTTGWKVSARRIKALVVRGQRAQRRASSDPFRIEVGQPLDAGFADRPGEPVLAILESNAYLVCTPERGGHRGGPYLFGKEEVLSVEDMLSQS